METDELVQKCVALEELVKINIENAQKSSAPTLPRKCKMVLK